MTADAGKFANINYLLCSLVICMKNHTLDYWHNCTKLSTLLRGELHCRRRQVHVNSLLALFL